MHLIENEFLRVKAREYGAELTSIYNKKTDTEHLWQADEKFWPWHAPVLFPTVGRSVNDEIIIDGVHYPMEKHGFARKSDFKLLELSDSKMVFSLTWSDETLKIYPYKFEFLIGYRLKENELLVSYEVFNRDDKPMYFQLGGHPAFTAPFGSPGAGAEAYEDYYLDFEQKETADRHFIDGDGFFDGRKGPVLEDASRIQLKRDLFKDDALIFKDLKSRKVVIGNSRNPYTLAVDFNGFNYLGLWAKVDAPYVCIEPWLGCAGTAGQVLEFSEREGVMMLEPGEEFNPGFTIRTNA
jgi:galactose mutarotase-like enzyme